MENLRGATVSFFSNGIVKVISRMSDIFYVKSDGSILDAYGNPVEVDEELKKNLLFLADAERRSQHGQGRSQAS